MGGMGFVRAAGGSGGGGSTEVNSVSFDGTNNDERIEIPITGGASANVANSDFTIEIWVRPTSNNNNTDADAFNGNLIVDGDNFAGTGGGFLFGINNNTIDVGVNTEGSAGYQTYGASTTVNNDQWHWLAMTYDISTRQVQFYINGTREVQQTAPVGDTSGNVHWESGGGTQDQLLVLGREKGQFNADGGYHGLISELRISNSVLYTAASITVPTSPLDNTGSGRAYYAFSEGTGSTVADTGGGTNSDGTIVNATWNSTGPYD